MSVPPPSRSRSSTHKYTQFDRGRLGLYRFRAASSGAPSLLCVPPSGGGPASFVALSKHLPETWGVCALDPPGRTRTGTEPLESIAAMAEYYERHVPFDVLSGSLLLGQSLGGYVVLALAKRLRARGVEPACVVVAAGRPLEEASRPVSDLGDDELLRWLIELGGMPDSAKQQREVFELFKRAIRADLRAYESCNPHDLLPVSERTLFVGALSDPLCTYRRFLSWKEVAPRASVLFSTGGHFCVQTNADHVAALLVEHARVKLQVEAVAAH